MKQKRRNQKWLVTFKVFWSRSLRTQITAANRMPLIIPPDNLDCAPICALTFDFLGLIKVTKARGIERGISAVWGEKNASRSVLAASIDDRLRNPVIVLLSTSGRNGDGYQGSDYVAS